SNHTISTYTLSLPDALPILPQQRIHRPHQLSKANKATPQASKGHKHTQLTELLRIGLRKPYAARKEHTHRRAVNHAHQRHHKQRSEEHTSELQSRFDLVCRL